MNITLEFWHLAAFVGMLASSYFATGKLLLSQIEKRLDERFASVERRIEAFEMIQRDEAAERVRIERDLLQLRVELAERYLRRDECSTACVR